jgi:hypothetical protein
LADGSILRRYLLGGCLHNLRISWSYLARNRPTFPDRALGRIYPLPYRRLTVYVTKFEYTLTGPPMWIVVAIAFVVAVTLDIIRRRLKNKNCEGRV